MLRYGYKFLRMALFLLSCLFSVPTFAADTETIAVVPLNQREDVKEFIDMMVTQHQFNREELVTLFGVIKCQPSIIKIMDKPAEGKPWKDYRPIFVTPQRIKDGVAFWQQNEKVLSQVEKQYGVPASVVVAILGAETFYGRLKGDYLVIESLSTLGFDYPRRAPFFKDQLAEFLLLTREEKLDPLHLKGSYAGAMGPGQFMPSNYRKYAVDYDNSGKRDLLNNMDDAIASVGNYLKEYGWQTGKGVAVSATAKGNEYRDVLDKGSEPFMPAGSLSRFGIQPSNRLARTEPVSVLQLEGLAGPELWVTQTNFYVITRYNKSPLYAMAVYQLSDEIAKAKKLGNVAITKKKPAHVATTAKKTTVAAAKKK